MPNSGFYSIKSLLQSDQNQKITAEIIFDSNHAIFQGHFPDNPIVPGVCLLTILKDILNTALQKNLFLFQANNIKFSAPIIPAIHSKVSFDISIKEIEDGIIMVNNSVFENETVFLKFKGKFK